MGEPTTAAVPPSASSGTPRCGAGRVLRPATIALTRVFAASATSGTLAWLLLVMAAVPWFGRPTGDRVPGRSASVSSQLGPLRMLHAECPGLARQLEAPVTAAVAR